MFVDVDLCIMSLMPPTSIDRGHIVFGLSVCLSAKTFTLAIAFEWYVIYLSYFTYIFRRVKPFL